MNVRRATEADVEAARRLWEASNEEVAFTPYEGSSFDPALVTDQVALIAEDDDGEIAGVVYANAANPHYGFVFGLFVRPEARRRGVARLLMRAVASELRESGMRYVVLSVDTPNEAARHLYDKLGFVDAARMLRVEIDQLVS